MRPVPASLTCCLLIACALPAAAQTAEERSPFAIHAGIGTVSSSSFATPEDAMLAAAGVDFRLGNGWELRFEAGRRDPARRWIVVHTKYYLAGSSSDVIAASEVDSTTIVHEHSKINAAVLLRRYWVLRERFELAGLAGLDMDRVDYRAHTTIPLSLSDPSDVEIHERDTTFTRVVFDVGLEAGVRIDDRWTALLYTIAGLQSPFEESRDMQARNGVILKYRF